VPSLWFSSGGYAYATAGGFFRALGTNMSRELTGVSTSFKRFPIWILTPMYKEPDGRFFHHIANPLLLSAIMGLQTMVLKEKADIGVAFDGDADRAGFIDENGERVRSCET